MHGRPTLRKNIFTGESSLRGSRSSAISELKVSASEESTTMKLYSMDLSNFATKSRLVIYEKGLNVEMAAIPGGKLSSPEYAQVNMLGKIPALDADGLLIPESEVINEYLEDKYPTPPLLPKSPEGRAKVTDLKNRIGQLEKMLSDGGFACGSEFTLADCALAPTIFFVTNLGPAFGLKPLDGHPKIAAWWSHVQTRPSVKKGLAEMAEALAAMQRGGR